MILTISNKKRFNKTSPQSIDQYQQLHEITTLTNTLYQQQKLSVSNVYEKNFNNTQLKHINNKQL